MEIEADLELDIEHKFGVTALRCWFCIACPETKVGNMEMGNMEMRLGFVQREGQFTGRTQKYQNASKILRQDF